MGLTAFGEVFLSVINDLACTNGPQFVTRDLKTFIQQSGMTHVRTIPYYPQSNGKIERWHKSLERECIQPATPLFQEGACQSVNRFVMVYDRKRLRSAIGYVPPNDKLERRESTIFAERKRKLAAARKARSLSQSSSAKGSLAERSSQDRDG